MSDMLEMAHCRIEELEDTIAGVVSFLSTIIETSELSVLQNLHIQSKNQELFKILH